MSIAVPLDELDSRLATYPWALLLTVSDDHQARVLAVPTRFAGGVFTVAAGRGARANAAARPDVTMVFPPAAGTDYSLIVDGRATVSDDHLEITPSNAVLHRPAL